MLARKQFPAPLEATGPPPLPYNLVQDLSGICRADPKLVSPLVLRHARKLAALEGCDGGVTIGEIPQLLEFVCDTVLMEAAERTVSSEDEEQGHGGGPGLLTVSATANILFILNQYAGECC